MKKKTKGTLRDLLERSTKSFDALVKTDPRRRHYCFRCKAKKEERFMDPVEMSINNRVKWECKDCTEEHRRYGREWR